MESLEVTILENLIYNEEYSRKVIPFIEPDYFQEQGQKIVFEETVQFITKYDTQITVEALLIEVSNRKDLTEQTLQDIQQLVGCLEKRPQDHQWLLDSTEKW